MAFKYTVVTDTLAWAGYDVLESPQEMLGAIKQAGYGGADLPGDRRRVNAVELRRVVSEVGLEVPEVLCAWAYFHAGENRDLTGEDKEARDNGIRYVKETINLAAEVGARFINVCAPQPPVPQVPFPRLPITALRRNLLISLREICEHAQARGIAIVFEPLNCYEAYPGVLTTLADAAGLIEELARMGFDNVGIQPDVFHMNVSEASMLEAIRASGKYIKHFHMNETNHYALGAGHADLKGIVRTLKEIGYSGYIAIYMPFISQAVFQLAGRGYGSAGEAAQGDLPIRPDLGELLGRPIQYLKELERAVEGELGCP